MRINKHEVFKNVAWLGLTLLVAGVLRYFIQETLTTVSKALLIAGAALFVIGLGANYRSALEFFARRGTKLGTNTLILTVSVLAILVVVNVLAARHTKRFDLTEEKLYSLSDQTKKVVTGLKADVTVMKFDKREDPALRDLMAEYKGLSGRIKYQFVDPQERPELAKQYNVARYGEAVVTSGARTEHLNETGEQEITNALLKLTRDSVKTVCFVEGHGEKSPASSEPEGMSGAEGGMKRENYQVKSVNLITQNGVPPDCSELIVAGPKKSFFPQEVEMVGKFLDAGGKAMLLFDPDTDPGFGDLLKRWKVELGNNTVVDVSGMGRVVGTGPAVPLVISYGAHPITKDFERSMTLYPLARSVKTAPASDNSGDQSVTALDLLMTSEESWAETDLKGGKAKYDEGKDTKGPVSLGVAASKKVGEKEARLIVIGDSDFASNRFFGAQMNGDLFMNAVNWLAQDEDLISVRPKSPKSRRVTLTQSQQNMMFWLSTVLLPGIVVLAGAILWWKRR